MEWKCVLSLSMFTCVSDLLSFRILLHRSYFRPIKMVPSWVPWCLSFPWVFSITSSTTQTLSPLFLSYSATGSAQPLWHITAQKRTKWQGQGQGACCFPSSSKCCCWRLLHSPSWHDKPMQCGCYSSRGLPCSISCKKTNTSGSSANTVGVKWRYLCFLFLMKLLQYMCFIVILIWCNVVWCLMTVIDPNLSAEMCLCPIYPCTPSALSCSSSWGTSPRLCPIPGHC